MAGGSVCREGHKAGCPPIGGSAARFPISRTEQTSQIIPNAASLPVRDLDTKLHTLV